MPRSRGPFRRWSTSAVLRSRPRTAASEMFRCPMTVALCYSHKNCARRFPASPSDRLHGRSSREFPDAALTSKMRTPPLCVVRIVRSSTVDDLAPGVPAIYLVFSSGTSVPPGTPVSLICFNDVETGAKRPVSLARPTPDNTRRGKSEACAAQSRSAPPHR